MGCSPSSATRRRHEDLLALAVAQETLLLQQHQQNVPCHAAQAFSARDPAWLESSAALIMPPAYSEEPPPGHTSYAANYAPGHAAGQPERSTPRETHGYAERPRSAAADAAPATTPPPLLRRTRSRRGSRASRASETSPQGLGDGDGDGGDDGPAAPRRRLRARRRISPMPMQSPPSRSSLRSAEDSSEAQAALLAMTRPVSAAATSQRAAADSSTAAASTSVHAQGRPRRATTSPGERHQNAASGPADDGDDDNRSKEDAGNGGETLLNTLVESVSDLNLRGQGTPTATGNGPDSGVCQISYTPTDTTAPDEESRRAGGQQSGVGGQQSAEPGDARRVLFPSSQHRAGASRTHQTPWHEQMLAVGKRPRSERAAGPPAHRPSHRHHHRHGARSHSTTDPPPVGLQGSPAAPASGGPRSHSVSRIPPLTLSKDRIETRPLSVAAGEKAAGDGVKPALSPESIVTAAPHLRPVRTREFQRLPPMENSNNTGAALPNVLSRPRHISSQSLSRKAQHRFITGDVQALGY